MTKYKIWEAGAPEEDAVFVEGEGGTTPEEAVIAYLHGWSGNCVSGFRGYFLFLLR